MRYLDHTCQTPEENLALDEALLDLCEEGFPDEILRVWQPEKTFVVLGYANSRQTEVNLNACRLLRVPVLRRCSGGGTVIQGPGCLNFSLILRIRPGKLSTITGTTHWILKRHQRLLASMLKQPVSFEGSSDLAVNSRKCCGHAQRRRRRFLLFHGSFLLNADFRLMEKLLPLPSRHPAYRHGRNHAEFLVNLPLKPKTLKMGLRKTWGATGALKQLPLARMHALVAAQYARRAWNYKF